MENTVNQRLMKVVDYFTKGNEKRFAERIGVSPAVINNYTTGKQQSKPGFEVLAKICEQFPDINIEWLINGRGLMLRDEATAPRLLVSTQDTQGNVTVPIINRRAAANFLTGYQSQEYFEELDALLLPGSLLREGQYFALQVSGDSMAPTLHDSDLVICRQVDRGRWDRLPDGEVCVVASETKGLQVKRIQNTLADGYLRCLSDNREHPPFNLLADDILEVWKVGWKLSAYLANDADGLHHKLDELEARMAQLEGR
jgi:phage repressor protein C with HTH and peptisase S24 domain